MTDTAAPDLVEQARVAFDRALKRNIKGLGYFASPAPVLGASPKDVLIQRGTMNLYHYRPMSEEVYRVPLLLVMATTNRGYIFDMVPGQSLVEFLLKRGYDVFMLDWSPPRPDEKDLSLEHYVLDFLPAAIARIAEETGEPDLTLVGYCFGGVLSVLWAALHPDGPMANLVTFTTPIDFKAMEMFQAWADRRFFDVDRLVDTFGCCPADMLYTSFDMLRPAQRLAGQIRLLDNLWNDEFVKSYRMFDRWTTDMLPLAGEYFRQTTRLLMWENRLYEGTMEVGGRQVDLGNITAPFLHVVAEHDHIVPKAASAPLIDMIGSADKEEIVLKGGHVSLVAGGNAVRRLWPKLDDWLQERSL
ncbi:putative polyhydroxyalkanoate synthase [Sphingomonas changbaiensis NBRC 104936]|uniref:Putative polyhydroxyalkanoate synthase n=1 Tax=Sphingomonas changbaiensis NBRC 104936 TaxID=1219043 RepID=A0A0E9MPB3_9SPHN|nr:alpha/beta fold hydrolase [Sphingomonas changbaiensis]GAO39607.1 putative polyhydroxyalkanoate synthase [Sphingomonas changbaiensis NBRC 104936]